MTILPQQRVLLFKRGVFQALLMPGRRFVSPAHAVEIYKADEAFKPARTPIEVLLGYRELAEQLEIVEVPDNHIAICREDGNIARVHGPGRICYWKGLRKREFSLVDLDRPEAALEEDRSVLLHPAVKEYTLGCSIEEYQAGLLFIDRAFVRQLPSGTYFFWKGTRSVNVEKIDLRMMQAQVTGQEIMSRDKVPLRLNFFCQYRITDLRKAALEVKDPEAQFHVLLQLALREYVGSLSFDEILERKEEIGGFVARAIADKAAGLGLAVGEAGIKDVILPGEISAIMNQVLIAEKKAQANVIMRREETASTRSLLNTAKLMEENEVLARLKELEYVERISEKISQITLSGGNQIVDQLRGLFLPQAPAGKAPPAKDAKG